MPVFALSWKQTYFEDYGYDHEVETGKGVLNVQASSISEIQTEIEKFKGCQTNYRESISVVSITETKPDSPESLDSIGLVLDPWNIKELRPLQ
jgi:hypothetical protein